MYKLKVLELNYYYLHSKYVYTHTHIHTHRHHHHRPQNRSGCFVKIKYGGMTLEIEIYSRVYIFVYVDLSLFTRSYIPQVPLQNNFRT